MDEVGHPGGAYVLGCGHAMHTACLDGWITTAHEHTCPVCRTRMHTADVAAIVHAVRMRGWCERFARIHPLQQRVVWDTMDALLRECEDGMVLAFAGLL